VVLTTLLRDAERLGWRELSEGVGGGLVVDWAKTVERVPVGSEKRLLRQSRLCAEQTAGWWRGGRVTSDEGESCLPD
jgi:hypothetical protein